MARLLKKKSAPQEESFLPNVRRLASLAADHKALKIRAYDVRGLTLIADVFLICTAASEPQMKAIYNAARRGMTEVGVRTLHTEGTAGSGWILLDYGDVILHIFRKEQREFYDLDGLWGDAAQVELDLGE